MVSKFGFSTSNLYRYIKVKPKKMCEDSEDEDDVAVGLWYKSNPVVTPIALESAWFHNP
jgi:hypothetical protein